MNEFKQMNEDLPFDEEKKESKGLDEEDIVFDAEGADEPQVRRLFISHNKEGSYSPSEFKDYAPEGFFRRSIEWVSKQEEDKDVIVIRSQTREESRGQRIFIACVRMNPQDFDYASITNNDVDLMLLTYNYLDDSMPYYNLYQYLVDNTNTGAIESPRLNVSRERMNILSLARYNVLFWACLPLKYSLYSQEEKKEIIIIKQFNDLESTYSDATISDEINFLGDLEHNIFSKDVVFEPNVIKHVSRILSKNDLFCTAARYNRVYVLDQLENLGATYTIDCIISVCESGAIDSLEWFMEKGTITPSEYRDLLQYSTKYSDMIDILMKEIDKTPHDSPLYYMNALTEATQKGHIVGLKKLIDEIKISKVTDVALSNLLRNAARYNQVGTSTLLLDYLDDYNEGKESKNDDLYHDLVSIALQSGNEQIALMILDEMEDFVEVKEDNKDLIKTRGQWLADATINNLDNAINLLIKKGFVDRSVYEYAMNNMSSNGYVMSIKKLSELFVYNDYGKQLFSDILATYLDSNPGDVYEDIELIAQIGKLEGYYEFSRALYKAIMSKPTAIAPLVRIGGIKPGDLNELLMRDIHIANPNSIREIIKLGLINKEDYIELIEYMKDDGLIYETSQEKIDEITQLLEAELARLQE